MTDDLISEAGRLMDEQVRDFAVLERACLDLASALIKGDAPSVLLMTRSGESALQKMRARLVRIIQALTAFADLRAGNPGVNPLGAEVRAKFEASSKSMLKSAANFQKTRAMAAALTTSGATFATACIEVFGIKATTYKGPYTRVEGRPWA